jgi:glutamine amidotransferase
VERIAVVDYGMGNLRSVAKALEKVADRGKEIRVTSDPSIIAGADRVVFPGQGAIRDCMAELDERNLVPVIRSSLQEKPFLGICMGLQALMESSEEHADTHGLGILKGSVRRFPLDAQDSVSGERLKIPHMGWNTVEPVGRHPVLAGIDAGERFYFVHSYYVDPDDEAVVAIRSTYGVTFTCGVAFGRVFAVQFHPEKSQHAGLRLLENFLAWDPPA